MTNDGLRDVSVVVVHVDSDRPRPAVLEALLRQVESGTLRLLDFLVVRRASDGSFEYVEVDAEMFRLAGLGLRLAGLLSVDDARSLCTDLAPGDRAALVLVEPTWVERFSRELAALGADVLATHPVAGSHANAVWKSARDSRSP
ncbi:hypothetical protein FIV50_08465 [Microbacterium foliorum]|uniref:DUF1269 domain-containing protein n=1 Tax=Microbacterium foliorum TaxID=104336 RepID=A0A4Y5YPN7_9MICO|nr:DUF6325 family protein [Microbacterium foliorum]QDE34821.1 hypothetical protein FIV50_08465 [Microbacterium foliorum]